LYPQPNCKTKPAIFGQEIRFIEKFLKTPKYIRSYVVKEREIDMKKKVTIAFVFALLCSLSLVMYVGTVHAQAATHHIYQGTVTPVYDGKWTTNDEWSDGETTNIVRTTGAVTGAFVNKYATTGSFGGTDFEVLDEYIIEAFTDKTNDTGDYL
jgi:hypothetical protein